MSERIENNTATGETRIEAVGRATGLSPEAPQPASLSERVRSLRLPDQQVKKAGQSIVWFLGSLCLILALTAGGLGYLVLTQPKTNESSSSDSTSAAGDRKIGEGYQASSIGSVVAESQGY